MKRLPVLLLIYIISLNLYAQQTGADLIDASINFHDPNSNWQTANLVLGFNDTRPGQEDRSASFSMNNSTGAACVTREMDGRMVSWHIEGERCQFDVDGNFNPSDEEIEKYRLTNERGFTMRNYYLYLWGLPMKLKDPGTIIHSEVYERSFNGKPAKVVKVTYDEKVGSDIWYFYFDPDTYEMIGYQFYHDEEKGDGEYITLSGINVADGMKIPSSRSWFMNNDSTFLGTDKLVHTYSVHSH